MVPGESLTRSRRSRSPTHRRRSASPEKRRKRKGRSFAITRIQSPRTWLMNSRNSFSRVRLKRSRKFTLRQRLKRSARWFSLRECKDGIRRERTGWTPSLSRSRTRSLTYSPPRVLQNTPAARSRNRTDILANNSNKKKIDKKKADKKKKDTTIADRQRKRKRDKTPPPSPVFLTYASTKKEKYKKKGDKKKKYTTTAYRQRKRKRDITSHPSKEVFASGDNILVNLRFNDERKRIVKIKSGKNQRKRKARDLTGIKPIAFIDLDSSPFREITPSPNDVIIISDSEDGDKNNGNINQEMDAYLMGHKTHPERQAKFALVAKPQLRVINEPELDAIDGDIDPQEKFRNPDPPSSPTLSLHPYDLFDHQEEFRNPEPPSSPTKSSVVYDPFHPTKSRSPSPENLSQVQCSMAQSTENNRNCETQDKILSPEKEMVIDVSKSHTQITDIQPAYSHANINCGEVNPNPIPVIINRVVQPQAHIFREAISSINTSTPVSTNQAPRINILNSTIIPPITMSSMQPIAKTSPTKVSPIKSQNKPQIQLNILPKKTTICSKINEIIELNNDIESHYSPDSIDYEDLSEPPIELIPLIIDQSLNRKSIFPKANSPIITSTPVSSNQAPRIDIINSTIIPPNTMSSMQQQMNQSIANTSPTKVSPIKSQNRPQTQWKIVPKKTTNSNKINESIELNNDIKYPYSPTRSDYDDLSEPSIPVTINQVVQSQASIFPKANSSIITSTPASNNQAPRIKIINSTSIPHITMSSMQQRMSQSIAKTSPTKVSPIKSQNRPQTQWKIVPKKTTNSNKINKSIEYSDIESPYSPSLSIYEDVSVANSSIITSTPVSTNRTRRINIINSTIIPSTTMSSMQQRMSQSIAKTNPTKVSPIKLENKSKTQWKILPKKTTNSNKINERIELNNDIESPYSPSPSDYEDHFNPPMETTTSNKFQSCFDHLFDSYPRYRSPKKYRQKVAVKIDNYSLKLLDEVPNSAVEMRVKNKFLNKLNRQERVVEEVKHVIRPYYNSRHINKEEYKDVLRRAVPKICHNRSGEINPQKIRSLVEAYVRVIMYAKKRRFNF